MNTVVELWARHLFFLEICSNGMALLALLIFTRIIRFDQPLQLMPIPWYKVPTAILIG